jgi:hypothetical protein
MREQLVETLTTRRLKVAKAERRHQAFYAGINRGQALRVNRTYPHALVLWLELLRKQAMLWAEPFTIGEEDLAEMQILPQTRDRALAALEAAGFIRVDRQRGRLPRVWLVDHE